MALTTWHDKKWVVVEKPRGKRKYDLRFRYFESRPMVNPTGLMRGWRKTRTWWKPVEWLGNRGWFRYAFGPSYGKWTWWVRNHMTYD